MNLAQFFLKNFFGGQTDPLPPKKINAKKINTLPPVLPNILSWRGIAINLRQHPRAKRLILMVDGLGQPRLTVPYHVKLAEAELFLAKQERWLMRHLNKHNQKNDVNLVLLENATKPIIYLDGVAHLLLADKSIKGLVVTDGLGEDRLPIVTISATEDRLRSRALRFFKQHAAELITQECWQLYQQHRALLGEKSIKLIDVVVKDQHSRWGSCSQAGRINLNYRLAHFPTFIRHYVMCHELAHLRHMNHSSAFWDLVQAMGTNPAQARHWLRHQAARMSFQA